MRQVESIDIRSVVPISAATFFVLGCFSVTMTLVMVALAPGHITTIQLRGPISLDFSSSASPLLLVMYPFLTALVGVIGSVALAWLYNTLAPRVGPLRVNLGD